MKHWHFSGCLKNRHLSHTIQKVCWVSLYTASSTSEHLRTMPAHSSLQEGEQSYFHFTWEEQSPVFPRSYWWSLYKMASGVSPVLLLHCARCNSSSLCLQRRWHGKKEGSHSRYRRKESHSPEAQQTVRLAWLFPEISLTGMRQNKNITLPGFHLRSWDAAFLCLSWNVNLPFLIICLCCFMDQTQALLCSVNYKETL